MYGDPPTRFSRTLRARRTPVKPSCNALNKALTAALKLAAVAAIVVAIATMLRIGNAASEVGQLANLILHIDAQCILGDRSYLSQISGCPNATSR